MTPCAPEAHILRVVELDPDPTTPLIAECERCLSLLELAPNVCWRCYKPSDDHRWFLADTPVCPPS